MQKAKPFFFILITLLCSHLMAQEEEEDPDPEQGTFINSEWIPFLYAKGDQTINLALGVTIPTVFRGDSEWIAHNLNVGGTLSLGYNYFLTPDIYVGGEVNGMFAITKASNLLYIVPFGVRVGYQLVLHRFSVPRWMRRIEIPFTLTIGGAAQSYLDNEANYFGFFLKPGVSFFFRFNQDWSFGINTAWWWVPQVGTKVNKDGGFTPEKDVYGNFLEVTIAARYHF